VSRCVKWSTVSWVDAEDPIQFGAAQARQSKQISHYEAVREEMPASKALRNSSVFAVQLVGCEGQPVTSEVLRRLPHMMVSVER
jgi:hypothetical protein